MGLCRRFLRDCDRGFGTPPRGERRQALRSA